MGLVTLTFDLLTLKPVCESHQRWETFRIWARWAFGFSSYLLCTQRTDRQTKAKLIAPFPMSVGIKIFIHILICNSYAADTISTDVTNGDKLDIATGELLEKVDMLCQLGHMFSAGER